MNNYATPVAWTTILLALICGICFIVNVTCKNSLEKAKRYSDRGLVKMTLRCPSTYADRTIWVKEEEVEKYAKMNLGITQFEEAINNVATNINNH